MKTYRPLQFLIFLSLFLLVFSSTNCKKSSQNDRTLIGKWISTDMVDTLEFTSSQDLYKMINRVRDHYTYSLSGDSILVTYNGLAMPYIFLGPSKMRYYELDGTNLTIDFRNAYYGFSNRTILFHRRQF
jgi:hypothetical protein